MITTGAYRRKFIENIGGGATIFQMYLNREGVKPFTITVCILEGAWQTFWGLCPLPPF